ncbi:unnamed protein product [Brassicogethes aeneus]|uniref:Uncharacterized protein n=1 Tax=Brassicogethes aeneus TaxID=1431903 RepID=A0A9P0FFV5_BRAAE|nr:unnamed protein product [Brassicogethes aeneus]
MKMDLTKKCRACLNEDPEMHYLFAELDQGLSLAEILQNLNFEVCENDGFPPFLCQNCTVIMIDFFNLKTIYLENEGHLKELISQAEKQAEIEEFCEEDLNDNEELEENYEEALIEDENSNNEETVMFVVEENDEEIKDSEFKYEYLSNEELFKKKQKNLIPKYSTDDIEEKTTYLTYKKDVNSKKPWICDICGSCFNRKSDLLDHSESHSSEKKYICPYCGKSFKRRTVLGKHVRIHTHPREAICELCGKAFNDKSTLKTHIMLIHEKSRNFYCKLCGLSFPLKSTLEKHVLRHNPNRKRNFKCDLCFTAYRDKSSLKRHKTVKHSNNKVKCECGKEYTTITNLLKHQRKYHTGFNDNDLNKVIIQVEVQDSQ